MNKGQLVSYVAPVVEVIEVVVEKGFANSFEPGEVQGGN